MKMKSMLAAVLVALVSGLVPALTSADPGSAVQVDVTRLTGDLEGAHARLLADSASVITDATAGDKAAVRVDVKRLRADAATYLPAIRADLGRLKADVEAARAAKITGLGASLQAAVVADRQAAAEIRKAVAQARQAVKALRARDHH